MDENCIVSTGGHYKEQCMCDVILFGCRYITMMPRMRQALVEFENLEEAISCVQMCQVSTIRQSSIITW